MKRVVSLFLAICCLIPCCLCGAVSAETVAEPSDQTDYGQVLSAMAYEAIRYYDNFGERTDWEEAAFSADFILDFITRYVGTPGMDDYMIFEGYQTGGDWEAGFDYSVPSAILEKKVSQDFALTEEQTAALHTDSRYKANTDTYDFHRGGLGGFGVDYEYAGYRLSGEGQYTFYFFRYISDDFLSDTEGLIQGKDYLLFYDVESDTYLPHSITGLFGVTLGYDRHNAMVEGVHKVETLPETGMVVPSEYYVGLTAITTEADASGEGWAWAAETQTLTLDGLRMATYFCYEDWTEGVTKEESTWLSMGQSMICLPKNSTVFIKGDNAIHMETSGSLMNWAMVSEGKLNLLGEGSLTAQGMIWVNDIFDPDTYEILEPGFLVLDGPTLKVTSTGDFDYAISATKITQRSGYLEAEGDLAGASTNSLIVMDGTAIFRGMLSKEDSEGATGVYATAVSFYPTDPNQLQGGSFGTSGELKPYYHTGNGYTEEAKLGEFNLQLYNQDPDTVFVTKEGELVTDVRFSVKADDVSASKDGLEISGDEGVFSKETVIGIMLQLMGEIFDRVADALKELGNQFLAYEVTATENGQAVQPDGTVTMTVDIPLTFDLSRIAVFYVAEDGSVEQLPISIDQVARTALFYADHFSTYVLAETKEPMPMPLPTATVGDIDGDGNVNAADALKALQHAVKLITLEGEAFTTGDTNVDGSVDATDALLILQYTVKLIDALPVTK